MDTIFMNSGNSKLSNPYRLLLNPSDKIKLRRTDKKVTLSKYLLYLNNYKKVIRKQ